MTETIEKPKTERLPRSYRALLKTADKLGWPAAFREDLLVHDKETCKRIGSSRPFAWSVRQTGTDLIDVCNAVDRDWGLACAKRDTKGQRFYVWNGQQLREVSADEWSEWLHAAYSMLPTWRAVVEYKNLHSRPWQQFITARAADEETARKLLEHRAKNECPAYAIDCRIVEFGIVPEVSAEG